MLRRPPSSKRTYTLFPDTPLCRSAAHPGVDADHIGRLDAGLTKAADLVFVAPPTLLEAKKALNPCTFPAPHGVDAGLFAQASDPATEVPGAIARSEEHTSGTPVTNAHIVCRLLLEKKNKYTQ